MTHKMHEKAEAARALTRLVMAVRVAIRNGDEVATLANYTEYAKAGGRVSLDDIEAEEKAIMQAEVEAQEKKTKWMRRNHD